MKLLYKLIILFAFSFAEDDLSDRRVISINYSINEDNMFSLKDAESYDWYTELPNLGTNYDFHTERRFPLEYFSIFYIIPNKVGGYLSFCNYKDVSIKEDSKSSKQADEAQEFFINTYQNWNTGYGLPYVKFFNIESGFTFQPINNVASYLGLTYKNVDYYNNNGKENYINSKTYFGISLGGLIIPYQVKQYSGISMQVGYNHSFGFGGGFDLGIGYRF